MPKAQVVLRQLLRYGVPAIALSVAGSFSFVLLSGNTYVFDMFNNWFNTNIFHLPDESQPTDTPVPDFRPDSQIPNINIELPPISVDPDITLTTPVTVEPQVNVDTNLNLTPELNLQLNPELTVSPTVEFNPEISSDVGGSLSLELAPQITVSPFFQTNPERSIILREPDSLFRGGFNPIPTEAMIPEAPTPLPAVSPIPKTPLPAPKALSESPTSPLPQSDPLANKPDTPSGETKVNFQFPQEEIPTTPGTTIMTFDPKEQPPDFSLQLPVEKEVFSGMTDLPTTSTPSTWTERSTDSSDTSVSVPEPGMVMTMLLFGLRLLGFREKR